MDEKTIETILQFVLSDRKSEFESESVLNSASEYDWKRFDRVLKEHAILPLCLDCIRLLPEEFTDMKDEWKEAVYSNIYAYSRLVKRQEQILNHLYKRKISVVVLKGTSAAKYYPMPQLRTMGDIDLLVKPEDYQRAVKCLMDTGCKEVSSKSDIDEGRHRSFRYNEVSIELHHFFSLYVNEDKAQTLDNMLFDAIILNITELPDVENGLVILSHIRQHLEDGIGLRQIIDWLMFVNSCLNDEMWYSSFKEKVRTTGMERLAITVTRMCQIYLGLTSENITWCEEADEKICDDLMQYVLDCGNFGRSRELLGSGAVSKVPSLKQPIKLVKYIQIRGEENWKGLKTHPSLRMFAWIYQSCRYIKIAVQNRVGAKRMKSIYDEGQKRNDMFTALGIKIEHS